MKRRLKETSTGNLERTKKKENKTFVINKRKKVNSVKTEIERKLLSCEIEDITEKY